MPQIATANEVGMILTARKIRPKELRSSPATGWRHVAGRTTAVGEIMGTTHKVPEVQAAFTTAGAPDALVRVRVRDIPHLLKASYRRAPPGTRRHRHENADGA